MAPTYDELLQLIEQKNKILAEKDAELEREKQRRREAEAAIQPLQLFPFLEACHSLSLSIRVNKNPRSTTQGDTTSPVNRTCPARIVPWTDFPREQEKIWEQLNVSPSTFATGHRFWAKHHIDTLQEDLETISDEFGLRFFEKRTVETAVKHVVHAALEDEATRASLGLQGHITFQSHNSLSDPEEPVEVGTAAEQEADVAVTPVAKRRRTALSKGTADQSCIYRYVDGTAKPIMAIEYKAPHKLTLDQVVTGLESEIQPARDVIGQDNADFVSSSRGLCTAVITQLFSYMVSKAIRLGYVCTGEAFIFLCIKETPSVVYYYVSVPNKDVGGTDATSLRQSAVAQVSIFTLQAMGTRPPPLGWSDAAAALPKWKVSYDDVLCKIPATVRQTKRQTPYKGRPWKGETRLCTGCQPSGSEIRKRKPDDDNDDNGDNDDEDDEDDDDGRDSSTTGNDVACMEDAPFCTHACLLGLLHGSAVDPRCPNAKAHGALHIAHARFLAHLHHQLATDRGDTPNCVPLFVRGLIGGLFKIRTLSTGYTFVAKGVETPNRLFLAEEERIYRRLSSVQGEHVPVCLSMLDLALPYYADGGIFLHFLLMSWAGRPVHQCLDRIDEAAAVPAAAAAFEAIHRLGVLQGDAEVRNVMYDEATGKLLVVDFERGQLVSPPTLSRPAKPNINNTRKRRLGQDHDADARSGKGDKGVKIDYFANELQCIQLDLADSFARHRQNQRAERLVQRRSCIG